MARVLLGVTGGIAAYKACELVRLLVKAGHDVLPVPTRGAEEFVRAQTFFALARKSEHVGPYPHLEQADLLVIAPLTANTMAKLAHGLADDVLTEAALAHRGPDRKSTRLNSSHK
jgi:phosphopantothenoylcysteine decarboxylase/phosphopantothenate--cysteine ligase